MIPLAKGDSTGTTQVGACFSYLVLSFQDKRWFGGA